MVAVEGHKKTHLIGENVCTESGGSVQGGIQGTGISLQSGGEAKGAAGAGIPVKWCLKKNQNIMESFK